MKLTAEQQKAYLASGGMRCPNCQSTSIESDSPDCNGDLIHQNVECLDCQAEWVDVFQLFSVEDV